MTTHNGFVPTPVIDAPVGLEDRVKHSLEIQDHLKREATARAAIQTAMVGMVGAATSDLVRKNQQKKRRDQKPRKPAPMAAIRLGRMAEAAWDRLTPLERQQGLPLWKLAALANLHFIPVPARKLHELHGTTMVFELVKPTTPAMVDQTAPEAIPLVAPNLKADRRLGFAFVSRALPGMGSALLGIKIFDHQGNVLMVAGQAPLADFEKVSPFTQGIFEGQDVLPKNWVYRTKAQEGSIELTQFIAACLPRRQEL
ncbi:MAG: hypothetical protein WC869_00475 [Phycisphaerae bacterium]|jgi:hypothetical protein